MSEIDEFIATLADVRQDAADLRKQIEAKAAAPAALKDVTAELSKLRQAIQSANPGAVVEAAERGAKAAAGDLRDATGTMRAAIQTISAMSAGGWKLKAAAAVALVLLGVVGGVLLGVRAFPNSLMKTETGCHIAGGYWNAAQGSNSTSTCMFFDGMSQYTARK